MNQLSVLDRNAPLTLIPVNCTCTVACIDIKDSGIKKRLFPLRNIGLNRTGQIQYILEPYVL